MYQLIPATVGVQVPDSGLYKRPRRIKAPAALPTIAEFDVDNFMRQIAGAT